MQGGDLEARLVAAGVELLAEAGTDALTLREIARRAGVSHGAPRRYFPTHHALRAAPRAPPPPPGPPPRTARGGPPQAGPRGRGDEGGGRGGAGGGAARPRPA